MIDNVTRDRKGLGVWVQSLVRELRHHMPHDQKQNRSNTVTNSIKTFKMSHIKKKEWMEGWEEHWKKE